MNSLSQIWQRLGYWWKFKVEIVSSLAAAFVTSFLLTNDLEIASIVTRASTPLSSQMASIVASTIPVSSANNQVFWLIFLSVWFIYFLVFVGIAVILGRGNPQ